jgi:ribosomal protein S12 methylthiotransferase
VRLVVDGPSSEHQLVMRGRLEGQAPDIDPLVYLTECDPAELTPGQFLDVEITGARDYDLLARPATLSVTVAV